MPAQAGIHDAAGHAPGAIMGPRLRGDDGAGRSDIPVMPAQAGIHDTAGHAPGPVMGPRVRGDGGAGPAHAASPMRRATARCSRSAPAFTTTPTTPIQNSQASISAGSRLCCAMISA